MSHFEVLERALEAWGPTLQRTVPAAIVRELREAGFIIVRKGAIGQAQREAVAAYREDLARPKIGENA